MNYLSVSEAHEQDIPEIAGILTDATMYKVKKGDKIWGGEGWTDEEVKDYMAESEMFLVKQGQEIVGTVSLQWEDERTWGAQPPIAGYMHRLAIKEGHHGQGLGEQVIDWVATKVAEQGKELLRLDCPEDNQDLCKYYEKLGFTKTGSRQIPKYDDHNEATVALYERPVDVRK